MVLNREQFDAFRMEIATFGNIPILSKPQIRNPTKVSERCGPNRQECDFSSLD